MSSFPVGFSFGIFSVDSSLEVFSGDSDEGIGKLNRVFPCVFNVYLDLCLLFYVI